MTVAELFANDPIEIKIVKTHDSQCKIGVTAPRELTTRRNEIYEGSSSQVKYRFNK